MGRLLTVSLLVLAVAVGCGQSAGAKRDDQTTPTPASTTVVPKESTDVPFEPRTLVVFGDSFANLNGWPTEYAAMITDEFGADVAVEGDVCFGGCASLNKIRGSERLQKLIAGADVIVLQPQPGRVVAPLWRSYFAGDCGGSDGLRCFRDAEMEFRRYVEELFEEVTELSQPGAVIRATVATGTWAIDAFHPDLREADPGTFDVFLDNMTILGEVVASEAAERCIEVVDVNAIMSGPDYRQRVDPEYAADGKHPSGEGSRAIAESLHRLGYEATSAAC